MRRVLVLVMVIMLTGVVQAQEGGAPGIGDLYFPELGNGGYDVQHYTLDLDVQPADNTLEALVTIEAIATQDLSRFNLDFWGLTVDAVTVNDEAATFSREGIEMTITPATPLLLDERFTVQVAYHGSPQPFTHESDPYFELGWQTLSDGGSWVGSEPVGAINWFPSNNHPLDKATFTLQVTVPTPYVVVSNGRLVAETSADDLVTTTWENDDLTATYLVTLGIGDLVRYEQEGPDGVLLRYYFDADVADQGPNAFANVPAMLAFFSERFGPYPFDEYGAVVYSINLGAALETQTMTSYGRGILSGEGDEATIAHELAHEWFGNHVSLAQWHDMWLKEGLATYAELLWLVEASGGTIEVYDDIIRWGYNQAQTMQDTVIGKPDPNDLYNWAVYIRGALVFHALRAEVGDTAFWQILQTYVETYGGGNASSEDFFALAEQVSGQELDALWEAWVYQSALPPLPQLPR